MIYGMGDVSVPASNIITHGTYGKVPLDVFFPLPWNGYTTSDGKFVSSWSLGQILPWVSYGVLAFGKGETKLLAVPIYLLYMMKFFGGI